MGEQASATIIPFPPRRGGELAGSTERLCEALASLSLALTEQRKATERWRDALHALSARMQGVSGKPA